jgi:hypothetical protein
MHPGNATDLSQSALQDCPQLVSHHATLPQHGSYQSVGPLRKVGFPSPYNQPDAQGLHPDPLRKPKAKKNEQTPEKGFCEFLVHLLGSFSHKNNDPYLNARDTPGLQAEMIDLSISYPWCK